MTLASPPKEWRLARMGELAAGTPYSLVIGPFGSDLKTSDYTDQGVPIVFVRDVQPGRYAPKTRKYVSERKAKKLAPHTVRPGDLVITKMGLPPCVAAVYPDSQPVGIVTADIIKMAIDSTTADREYVGRYLNSPFAKREIARFTFGVTRPKVTLREFKELQIPLPPLPEQKRIAAILDKADAVRRKRQRAIDLTEEFLRSVFLDMFGMPAFNKQKFPRVALHEIAANGDGIKCGPFGTQLAKSEYQRTGVPLWGIKHVNSHFSKATDEFLTEQKANALAPYSLVPGDLVMTRKGTVGNCSIYPRDFPSGIMHSDVLRVRLNPKKSTPHFMSWQLSLSQDAAHQISLLSHGAIMAGINVTKLKAIEILLPPLPMQQQFDAIVAKQAELARLQEAKSTAESDLFNSLVQRAFRGEL